LFRLRIVPVEKGFFELFELASSNMLEAAKLLEHLASDYEEPERKVGRITEREHQGDTITHEIIAKLNSTFVTPFDREDIHRLTSAIDDVVDNIEAAADIMLICRVEQPTEDVRKFAEIIVKCAEQIHEAIPLLRHRQKMKGILTSCIEINRLENQADRINRAALIALFASPSDPLDVVRWRDIYGQLENAVDRCEDVADALQAMVMKHA